MSEAELPGKLEVARALLGKGSLFLHLDPRIDSVVVPAWLSHQPQLVLQVGREMVIPIPDLQVGDDGVSATLSFNRQPFHCVLPWRSVFALVGDDGRGMVWPESMPAEIAAEVEREAQRATAAAVARASEARGEPEVRGPRLLPSRPAPETKSHVQLASSRPRASASRPPARMKSLPPYLRVVK